MPPSNGQRLVVARQPTGQCAFLRCDTAIACPASRRSTVHQVAGDRLPGDAAASLQGRRRLLVTPPVERRRRCRSVSDQCSSATTATTRKLAGYAKRRSAHVVRRHRQPSDLRPRQERVRSAVTVCSARTSKPGGGERRDAAAWRWPRLRMAIRAPSRRRCPSRPTAVSRSATELLTATRDLPHRLPRPFSPREEGLCRWRVVHDLCVACAPLFIGDTQLHPRAALDAVIAALPNSLGATK